MTEQDGDVVLSGADLSGEDPDLKLIQDAAETFHSEFLTRVLQEEEGDPTRRRRWPLFAAAAGALMLVLAVVVVARWPRGTPDIVVRTDSASHTPPRRPADSGAVAVPAPDGRPRPPLVKPRRRRHGHLHLNSIPWSRVTIDGRRLKQPTPLVGLRLRAGWHRVTLDNRELGLRKSLRIYVRAGTVTRKLVRLR